MILFSTNSNICDQFTTTNVTDGPTDDILVAILYRATHLRASRGKNGGDKDAEVEIAGLENCGSQPAVCTKIQQK